MTTKYIYDLGLDASRQYALNQKELDLQLLEDSRSVPKRTEVSVVTPYAPSDYELKFAVGRITIWAAFAAPLAFALSSARLFTHQLIPSLGNLDDQVALLDRFAEALPEDPALQKEHETLRKMLDHVVQMGRTFEEIKAQQFRFQKG